MDSIVRIKRIDKSDKQILGRLSVLNGRDLVYTCHTLEKPFRGNKKRISAIPSGNYNVVKRVSPKFGLCFHVLDVPNRKYILIHAGNYVSQTLGCILVGSVTGDFNNDGLVDVGRSKATIKALLNVLPNEFRLIISE